MVEQIYAKVFTLAADGDATGILNITSNLNAYPGAKGYLVKADGTLGQKVHLTELVSTTSIGVRFIAEDINDVKLRTGVVKKNSTGRSDCTGYVTGSFLIVEDQVVPVVQPIFDPKLKA